MEEGRREREGWERRESGGHVEGRIAPGGPCLGDQKRDNDGKTRDGRCAQGWEPLGKHGWGLSWVSVEQHRSLQASLILMEKSGPPSPQVNQNLGFEPPWS